VRDSTGFWALPSKTKRAIRAAAIKEHLLITHNPAGLTKANAVN
jgi:hypothetical protein